MEFTSSSELEVQAAYSMHLVNPQQNTQAKGESETPQQHSRTDAGLKLYCWCLSLTAIIYLLLGGLVIGSNGLNSVFIKKCKIPAQLARHTALQLPLCSYKFIPTLTQPHTLLASCLFCIVVYTRTYSRLLLSGACIPLWTYMGIFSLKFTWHITDNRIWSSVTVNPSKKSLLEAKELVTCLISSVN